MSAKHTPGPWFTTRLHGTIYVEANLRGTLIQEVAACGPTEARMQQEANARLIAAAPELLNALAAIVGALEALGDSPRLSVIGRAAIDKATGEQS